MLDLSKRKRFYCLNFQERILVAAALINNNYCVQKLPAQRHRPHYEKPYTEVLTSRTQLLDTSQTFRKFLSRIISLQHKIYFQKNALDYIHLVYLSQR